MAVYHAMIDSTNKAHSSVFIDNTVDDIDAMALAGQGGSTSLAAPR